MQKKLKMLIAVSQEALFSFLSAGQSGSAQPSPAQLSGYLLIGDPFFTSAPRHRPQLAAAIPSPVADSVHWTVWPSLQLLLLGFPIDDLSRTACRMRIPGCMPPLPQASIQVWTKDAIQFCTELCIAARSPGKHRLMGKSAQAGQGGLLLARGYCS
jgi:hypothetical protein